eukprot:CAMPEP_0182916452 /NCGR_PEP_ID=MMETSP0105_2-20130417/945_1 /TAXON_ID=81532 ORGANISM="Acanthoeca-like sp., Strain 10tr" /NCGR_SAMPLE_ID=MMETSP0105_2 /ASSEMBLY_ACC=CAM_ASM_000205 /LENGTH=559 /DNA_ID=CAMNT_0025053405 /DNA_START=62 /DNA_END=1744 /DNA_ORIENTATION=+
MAAASADAEVLIGASGGDAGDATPAAAVDVMTNEVVERLQKKNHYERLGVADTADVATIETAYKEANARFDPEQAEPEMKEVMEQCSKLINNAMEILSDPQERKHYDNWIQGVDEGGEDIHVLITEGQLTKAGGSKKLGIKTSWKVRWFKLTTNALVYFTKKGGEMKGGVLLETVTQVRVATASECKNLIHKHAFSIVTNSEDRVYTMSCKSDEERDEWIRLVSETCNVLSFNAMGESTGTKRLTASRDHKGVTGSAISQAKDMNHMDGTEQADDVIVTGTMAEALTALVKFVDESKAANADSKMWDFRGLHIGTGVAAGKTVENIYESYLRWSQKPDDVVAQRFNVSKAFRRVLALATWQEEYADTFYATAVDLNDPEMVALSEMLPTIIPDYEFGPDAGTLEGTVPMFISLTNGKVGKGKQVKHSDEAIMRFFLGKLLPMVFDPPCQVHGIVIVEEVTGLSFFDMIAVNSALKSVEPMISTLFYKCIPVKIKALAVTVPPWWMSALLRMIRLFLNKKQTERLHALSTEQLFEMIGGANALPSGWLDGRGTHDYKSRY